jgi:hypothetical protein
MFIEIEKTNSEYTRTSKSGTKHTYSRTKTILVFNCDNCNNIFKRNLGNMDHRRISNNYFHVCPNCNPKQFAQKKGVERRQIWNLPVDSDIDISRF